MTNKVFNLAVIIFGVVLVGYGLVGIDIYGFQIAGRGDPAQIEGGLSPFFVLLVLRQLWFDG